MYRYLANKLSDVFQKKQITQQDLDTALHEVTQALLDADVALEAVEAFKSNFSAQNIEQQREKGLDAKSQLMNEVRRCLLTLLTDSQQAPTLNKGQLHNIVLCGLQGAGKTTTCAKLAQHYLSQELKILMCSTDIYRPAAMEQLRQLATQIGVDYFDTQLTDAVQIALDAQQHAKSQGYDLLIIDTAGRLNLDVARMQEAAAIVKKTTPQQCLYVVDSMIGQSALTVAKAFNEHLPLNGVILTKTDSDAKGGVALSVRHITKQPIRWIGTGEHINELQPFNPEQAVDQMLDMGDLLSLAKKAEKHINKKAAEKTSARMLKGEFSFEDMLSMLGQIRALGGMKSILQMLPGSAQIPQQVLDMADQQPFDAFEVMLKSMTQKERNFPALILNNDSRKRRVLKGSGRSVSEFNALKKSFQKVEKMMQKMRKGKFKQMLGKFMQNNLDPSQF